MKKIIKITLCLICFILGLNLLLAGCFYYAVNCKETLRDTSFSPNGEFELLLMEIGEPEWPFGAASGQLILREGDIQISQADFKLKNDGCSISSSCWAVTWNMNYVEVILSGEEQFDELILLYFDGTMQRQSLTYESEPTIAQSEINALDIEVMENRENELVFSISITDYVESYNNYFEIDHDRSYLTPAYEWQQYIYDSSIHSDHKTKCYYFTEDEQVYSVPTITVYVPTNRDYIQEITVNFDEHSYTEWGFEHYKQMCFYTLKVFFPDLSDETIFELCTEVITLGNQNVFSSDEWYSSSAVPFALFHKNGIGFYPYFAIGDWEYFCIIPVTEENLKEFEQKGVEIHEIQ